MNLDLARELVDLPEEPEPELPAYGVKGRILVRYWWGWDDHEVVDYDGDSSVFWLHEHGLIEHLVLDGLELDQPDGLYLIEVTAHYFRGDGWTTDDDIEVEIHQVRRTDRESLA